MSITLRGGVRPPPTYDLDSNVTKKCKQSRIINREAKQNLEEDLQMEHKHVAGTLEFLGWITMVAALFAGFIFAQIHTVTTDSFGFTDTHDEFSWPTALGIWFGGAISGFSLIGFARIIELLIELLERYKDTKDTHATLATTDDTNNEDTPDTSDASEETKEASNQEQKTRGNE